MKKTFLSLNTSLIGKLMLILILMGFSVFTYAQSKITGKVSDASGEPIIGASVIVKGTTNGTITDFDGNFSLNAPAKSTLEISYVGYKTMTVVAGNSALNVVLKEDTELLDEVVVVGYGVMKKRDLTGSVASVKAADIVKSPASNAMEALQGQVPGLDITRNSGKATSGVTINIRGKRSLSDVTDEHDNDIANAPLFIIDGMQGGNFADIAPSDIESIEVLKDASSTAIYGSQGANGVIIITTKKGAQGKVKLSYNGYYGVNGWAQYPKMNTGEDYINVRREAYRNTNNQWSSTADDQKLFTAEEWEAIQNGDWTDWVDLVNHTGSIQSHQVTASGGNEKTTAMLSAGFYQEKGSFKNDQMDKYNVRTNIEHKFNNWAKVGVTTQITHYAQDERADNVLWRAATNVPLGKAYDEDGNVVEWPLGTSSQISPLADEATANTAKHHYLQTNVIANGFLELSPIAGLTFRSSLGTNLNFYRKQTFEGAESIDRGGTYSTSKSSVGSSEKSYVNWDNVINYNKSIKDHSFGVTALTSYTQSKYTYVSAAGEGQLLDSYLYHNLGANDKSTYTIGSSYIQHTTFSYALRANYSYKGRYMITASNRWDGDSRLAAGNKWASFPSVAVAWRASDEEFLKNQDWLSNLKVRLSWGKTGNSGINEYGTQSKVTAYTNAAFQDQGYTYYNFDKYVGNKDVSWEISKTWDLGIDLGVFDGRINATIDLYKTNTSDILLPRNLPTSMGGSNATSFIMYQNIGSTMNKGVELSLNTVNIDKRNFKWTSTLSWSTNHEEITGLIDGSDIIDGENPETKSLLLGHPINSFYEYTRLGIWQESEREEAAKYHKSSANGDVFQPGDIKLKDLNGDYIIDSNDRGYIGSTSPKWTAGFNNTFNYKNFDLNVYLIARWGQFINYEFAGAYDPSGTKNFPSYFNYWTPENPSNDFPRPAVQPFYNYIGYQSLQYIEGSYWKIKTVSLGYTLPKKTVNRFGASNLRVYLTANNLLSVAANHLIKDYDAERGGSAKSPLQRQFVFGINLDF
jgi:TonB-linked SusC/RagA family outer membrane protein